MEKRGTLKGLTDHERHVVKAFVWWLNDHGYSIVKTAEVRELLDTVVADLDLPQLPDLLDEYGKTTTLIDRIELAMRTIAGKD